MKTLVKLFVCNPSACDGAVHNMVIMSGHRRQHHFWHTCHDPVCHRDGEAHPAAEMLWVVLLMLPHGCFILRVPAAQHDQLQAALLYPLREYDWHPFPKVLILANEALAVRVM